LGMNFSSPMDINTVASEVDAFIRRARGLSLGSIQWSPDLSPEVTVTLKLLLTIVIGIDNWTGPPQGSYHPSSRSARHQQPSRYQRHQKLRCYRHQRQRTGRISRGRPRPPSQQDRDINSGAPHTSRGLGRWFNSRWEGEIWRADESKWYL